MIRLRNKRNTAVPSSVDVILRPETNLNLAPRLQHRPQHREITSTVLDQPEPFCCFVSFILLRSFFNFTITGSINGLTGVLLAPFLIQRNLTSALLAPPRRPWPTPRCNYYSSRSLDDALLSLCLRSALHCPGNPSFFVSPHTSTSVQRTATHPTTHSA